MDLSTVQNLPREQKLALLDLLEEKIARAEVGKQRNDLLSFAKAMFPPYLAGAHHRHIAKIFKDVMEGKKKRVILNVAPRFGKSWLASYLFPAWFLGHHPTAHLIMATHTASLSEDFGRQVRNLLASEEYEKIFPETRLAEDSKGAGSWSTSKGGKYYAVGVGGALAGRGADLLVVDDAHSEQDVKTGSRAVFDQAWSWYQTGPRQRLMAGGAIVVLMTRWGMLDLTARLIDHQLKNPDSDQWEVIEFPAILNENTEDEKSLWPEKWPLDMLRATRATIDPKYWSGQYQQNPTSDTSAIIKREYWKIWEEEEPPACAYILMSVDTAHETKNTADYSACTMWGVFYHEEDRGPNAGKQVPNIIMLDAFKDRMEFPELKEVLFKHWKEWQPDTFLIEKKAAGAPLIQEFRRMGIPVQEYSPSRGGRGTSNDKVARVNAIADLFASGVVWAPDRRWAKEVIEECASFPLGEHDDYVDTVSQALLRFRQGGFITLDSDEQEEKKAFRSRTARPYY
jgi:predicted phage terminase large subunit-like protein